ncbi:MAG: SDR family oxidoreductase [Polyangiaceae bacterium]|nr:SDR family oxidoreductase [Polyangiaceae bacterium]
MSSSAPPAAGRARRRVLVCGATGRLGVAIARALAMRGDHVVVTARDAGRLEALAAELARLGPSGEHRAVAVDLRERDAPTQLREALHENGGQVEDIVLACGPFPHTPVDELRREDVEATLAVHAVAPLLVVAGLADDLRASQGAVVALGDAGVTRPYPNHVAYLAAKGALEAGLRALAVELAPHVRLNTLALGIVSDPEADADPRRTHRLKARSPLGRFGTPEEVVHATLALLDATWATGEVWGVGR